MEKEKQIAKKISTLSENDSKELLKSLIHSALSEDEKDYLTVKEKLLLLKKCKEAIDTKHNFKAGDIVKWKPNLKNRTTPEYDEPAIVVELINSPIIDREEDPGSTYFKEPLDIVLGIITEEGGFITFYFDKRRFQHFKSK